MLLLSVTIVIVLTSAASGQDYGLVVFNNTAQCINALVDWCNNMKYPQEGAGMAMLSVSYSDSNGMQRVFCSSDSDGTNCTRNGSPWFVCSPDNKLTYKGKPLTKFSTDVDDDICNTTDTAFNALFVQNLSYDNTTLKKEVEKGMENFFEEMAAMQEEIAAIQDLLKRLPFFGNAWSDDGFYGNPWSPFDRRDVFAGSPNITQPSTNSPNQIERE